MNQKECKRQSFLTMLAALSGKRLSGTLVYERRADSERRLEFLFHRGRLLYATSNGPGERLGEFLARRGVLEKESVEQAVEEAKNYGLYFHAYLAETGVIDYNELKDLLYQRTEELIDSIVDEEGGKIIFRPTQPEVMDAAVLWVDEELFARLLKHREIWPRVYEKFRNREIELRTSGKARLNPAYLTLRSRERRLLRLLQKPTRLSRLFEGRKNRLDLMILVERFLETGLVEIAGGQSSLGSQFGVAVDEAEQVASPDESEGVGSSEKLPGGREFTEAVDLPGEVAALAGQPGKCEADLGEAIAKRANPDGGKEGMAGPSSPAEDGFEEIGEAREPSKNNSLLDGVPVVTAGTRLEQISIGGLLMDDLYVISQIDGKSSVGKLLEVTGMTEAKIHVILERLIEQGYVAFRDRRQLEASSYRTAAVERRASLAISTGGGRVQVRKTGEKKRRPGSGAKVLAMSRLRDDSKAGTPKAGTPKAGGIAAKDLFGGSDIEKEVASCYGRARDLHSRGERQEAEQAMARAVKLALGRDKVWSQLMVALLDGVSTLSCQWRSSADRASVARDDEASRPAGAKAVVSAHDMGILCNGGRDPSSGEAPRKSGALAADPSHEEPGASLAPSGLAPFHGGGEKEAEPRDRGISLESYKQTHRAGVVVTQSGSMSVIEDFNVQMEEEAESWYQRRKILVGVGILVAVLLLPLLWNTLSLFGRKVVPKGAKPLTQATAGAGKPTLTEADRADGSLSGAPDDFVDLEANSAAEESWGEDDYDGGEDEDESKPITAAPSSMVVEGGEVQLEDYDWTPEQWRRQRAAEQKLGVEF